MSQRRALKFSNVNELIEDVQRLRRGYTQLGKWTLPQICFHVRFPLDASLKEPESTEPTEEQKKYQGFLELVIASGWPEKELDAPPPMRPGEHLGEEEIDAFLDSLGKLNVYLPAYVDAFIFGPVEEEKFRKFILAHAAHHLSFLVPMKVERRPDVRYADEDAAIADIERLRKGYAQAGDWSLPRMAWHLNLAVKARMKPGPHDPDTAEQIARRQIAQQVLAANKYLPSGIVAPDPMSPPADVPASAIDDLIASLKQIKAYKGEIAPHRIFGRLNDADARKLNLIHCAHHLSYLTAS